MVAGYQVKGLHSRVGTPAQCTFPTTPYCTYEYIRPINKTIWKDAVTVVSILIKRLYTVHCTVPVEVPLVGVSLQVLPRHQGLFSLYIFSNISLNIIHLCLFTFVGEHWRISLTFLELELFSTKRDSNKKVPLNFSTKQNVDSYMFFRLFISSLTLRCHYESGNQDIFYFAWRKKKIWKQKQKLFMKLVGAENALTDQSKGSFSKNWG